MRMPALIVVTPVQLLLLPSGVHMPVPFLVSAVTNVLKLALPKEPLPEPVSVRAELLAAPTKPKLPAVPKNPASEEMVVAPFT